MWYSAGNITLWTKHLECLKVVKLISTSQKLLLFLSKVFGKSLEDYEIILGKLHLFPDDKYCKSVHHSFQVDFIAYVCLN